MLWIHERELGFFDNKHTHLWSDGILRSTSNKELDEKIYNLLNNT